MIRMKFACVVFAGLSCCGALNADENHDTVFIDVVDQEPLDSVELELRSDAEVNGNGHAPENSTASAVASNEPLVGRRYHSRKSIPLSTKRKTSEGAARPLPLSLSLNDPNTRRIASGTSLAVGVLLLVMVVNRSMTRRKIRNHEMIEVLGRLVVSPKHHLHLVRVHNRMLLLAETPSGLTQLDSLPADVDGPTDDAIADSNSAPYPPPVDAPKKDVMQKDAEAERLLSMIQSSDSWKTEPLPSFRDSTYA